MFNLEPFKNWLVSQAGTAIWIIAAILAVVFFFKNDKKEMFVTLIVGAVAGFIIGSWDTIARALGQIVGMFFGG